MIPRASASSAVAGMFNDCRICVLDVRRNGLQAFSIFSVVGICPKNTYSLDKAKGQWLKQATKEILQWHMTTHKE